LEEERKKMEENLEDEHAERRNQIAAEKTERIELGNVAGKENPGVSWRVLLGLGYGLENLYPSKTRTPDAGHGYV
jgi:hypothetical protein